MAKWQKRKINVNYHFAKWELLFILMWILAVNCSVDYDLYTKRSYHTILLISSMSRNMLRHSYIFLAWIWYQGNNHRHCNNIPMLVDSLQWINSMKYILYIYYKTKCKPAHVPIKFTWNACTASNYMYIYKYRFLITY